MFFFFLSLYFQFVFLLVATVLLTIKVAKSLIGDNFFLILRQNPFFFVPLTRNSKRMRQYIPIFVVAAALMQGCSCAGDDNGQSEATVYQSIDTVPMLVMQIQQCARLYTTEYKVHKIVTHDDVVRLRGSLLKQDINIRLPLGDRKVAIPIDATLKAYIDFSNFTEANIECNGERLTIILPDPRVELTSSKVNQQEIRSYVGLVRAGFTDAELSAYEQQGREAIIQSIPQLGVIDAARANAARALVPMLVKMGYREQDVTIAFRRDFNPFNIRKLLET